MINFEVSYFEIETWNGKNPFEKLKDSTNATPDKVESFDNLDEAMIAYNKINTGVNYMGEYYLHACKSIEKVTYDDDGNYMDSMEIKSDFQDFSEEQ
jgi:hypothetical protein